MKLFFETFFFNEKYFFEIKQISNKKIFWNFFSEIFF